MARSSRRRRYRRIACLIDFSRCELSSIVVLPRFLLQRYNQILLSLDENRLVCDVHGEILELATDCLQCNSVILHV
jgi:hypothetical protein